MTQAPGYFGFSVCHFSRRRAAYIRPRNHRSHGLGLPVVRTLSNPSAEVPHAVRATAGARPRPASVWSRAGRLSGPGRTSSTGGRCCPGFWHDPHRHNPCVSEAPRNYGVSLHRSGKVLTLPLPLHSPRFALLTDAALERRPAGITKRSSERVHGRRAITGAAWAARGDTPWELGFPRRRQVSVGRRRVFQGCRAASPARAAVT